RGHDSPDGSRGLFMVEGFYSGRAGPIMHDHYNRRLVPGFSRQWDDGITWHGEAGPGDTPVVHVQMRPVSPAPDAPLQAGVHHYLGLRADWEVSIYSVAYSATFHPAESAMITFSAEASPLLRSLQPVAIPYASLSRSISLTFSPPQPISAPSTRLAAQTARV